MRNEGKSLTINFDYNYDLPVGEVLERIKAVVANEYGDKVLISGYTESYYSYQEALIPVCDMSKETVTVDANKE